MRTPVFLFLLVTGVLVAHTFRLPLWIGVGLILSGILMTGLSARIPVFPVSSVGSGKKSIVFTFFRPFSVTSRGIVSWLAVVMVMSGLGITTMALHEPAFDLSSLDGKEVYLRGKVLIRTAITRGERYKVETEIEGKKIELTWLSWSDKMFDPGDIIAVDGKILSEVTPLTGAPALLLLERRGADPVKLYSDRGEGSFLSGLRERFINRIENTAARSRTRGMLKALLIADRDGLGREEREALNEAGLSHALALSGLHVGILAITLLTLLLPLNLIRGRRFRFICAITFVWFFVLLTGAPLSAVRAALMFTLMGLGVILERRMHPFQGLCMAAILIILWNPHAIDDIGFQLSFMCVASLTLFTIPLNPVNYRNHPGMNKVVATFLTTIVATGATWMLMGLHFGELPTNFLIANIIVLPLLPFYMAVGLLHIFLSGIGFEIEWLGHLLDNATQYLFDFLAIFKGETIPLEITGFAAVLWCAGVLIAGISLNRSRLKGLPASMDNPVTAIWRPGIYLGSAISLIAVLTIIL